MKNLSISGIYCIENTFNHKKYIGSSKDIGRRIKRHFDYLKTNYHPNKHLQASYNKYTITGFKFYVLEECQEDMLFTREQEYLNNQDWQFLYNQTKIAGGGGSDLQKIPLLLLDLKGNIVKEFDCGLDIDKFLNHITSYSKQKNTPTIIKSQYRIVTPRFYYKNRELILSWKSYSNKAKHNASVSLLPKYSIKKDNETKEFRTAREVYTYTGISDSRLNQIVALCKRRNTNIYFHKNKNLEITILRHKQLDQIP